MSNTLYVPEDLARYLHPATRDKLMQMSPGRQQEFTRRFRPRAKSVRVAYLLLFIGFTHYPYLGKPKHWYLMLLSMGGVGLWAFADMVRMPLLVSNYNRRVGEDVLAELAADFQ
jgi:hypothetical protein